MPASPKCPGAAGAAVLSLGFQDHGAHLPLVSLVGGGGGGSVMSDSL